MITYGSLFTGIGGFDLGFDRAGMRCAWQVEIDRACHTVLDRHYPGVPRHFDVRDCGAHNLAPVDVISFGSPCQDLSVAGKRAGLGGERSGLFHEAIRIIRELRPTLAVWENVPGALSSGRGRDFGAVLDALAESGALDIGWRILDAQWFGVAQRRRRLFVVADFGGRRAEAILALADGSPRHPAPRRQAGQGVAGTLGVGSKGSGPHGLDSAGAFVANGKAYPTGWGEGVAAAVRAGVARSGEPERGDLTLVTADVAGTLNTMSGHHRGQDDHGDNQIVAMTVAVGDEAAGFAFCETGWGEPQIGLPVYPTLMAQQVSDVSHFQHGIVQPIAIKGAAIGRAPTAGPQWGETLDDGTCYTLNCTETHAVAHTLRAEGHDASEDGIGRGVPLIAFDWQSGGDVRHNVSEHHTSALQASQVPAVCGHLGTPQSVALRGREGGATAELGGDVAGADSASQGGGDKPHVMTSAVSINQRREVGLRAAHGSLNCQPSGTQFDGVLEGMIVRRLTPVECSRLQGFPDDWLDGLPDSARYRMLGNAVAVPVAAWLGRNIAAALAEKGGAA